MMSQDNNQEGGPLHVGDQCEMESCDFQYEDQDDLFFSTATVIMVLKVWRSSL